MQIKRHKNIVAVKLPPNLSKSGTAVAFHSDNLEVAEISDASFNEMPSTDTKSSSIPDLLTPRNNEAYSALEEWTSELNPDLKTGKIEFGIRSLTINVNQICNLKCAYCAAGGDGTYGDPTTQISIDKTLPQLKYFLSSLKPGAKFSITFVGGEPMLHPEVIKAIYDYVNIEAQPKDIRTVFTIVTNGTLFTPKNIEIINSMKIHVTVSLDGTAENNDRVRPSKNGRSSTDMTLSGLNELTKNKKNILSIGIAAVFSANNNELITNYLFLSSLKPDWIEFNFPYSEKSQELQNSFLSDMDKIAYMAWEKGGELELRKIKTFDHYFKMLDAQQAIENHCGAGKSYLVLDAKNKIYTCPWEVGEPSEVVGDGTTLNLEILSNYSKSLVELNNCQSCWAKNLCGGGCMYIHKEHTGKKHLKDNLFCERTRHLILTSIMYYKLSRDAA